MVLKLPVKPKHPNNLHRASFSALAARVSAFGRSLGSLAISNFGKSTQATERCCASRVLPRYRSSRLGEIQIETFSHKPLNLKPKAVKPRALNPENYSPKPSQPETQCSKPQQLKHESKTPQDRAPKKAHKQN